MGLMAKKKKKVNMFLDEKDCEEKINALTYQDWKPLLDLIPEIENTKTFGGWIGGEENEEGIHTLPICTTIPSVSQFSKIVYDIPIVIRFDWPSWELGEKMAKSKDLDFNKIDLVTKCKLITTIVRADRFVEGVLLNAFESGAILKILKSIEKEVRAKSRA